MDKKYEMPSDTQADMEETNVEIDNDFKNALASDEGIDLNALSDISSQENASEQDDIKESNAKINNDFKNALASDEGIGLNALGDTNSQENASEQGDYGNMVNIDEMQPELDLKEESSEYYTRGDETARQESEQFMQKHPDLFTESTISDNPPVLETPDTHHNLDSDTVVFGRHEDSEAGKPYSEVGKEENHAYFDSESYESDAIRGRLDGESKYDSTGNSDFVNTTGEKEKIFTDKPINKLLGDAETNETNHTINLGDGGINEFNHIQEATGITVDDIYKDDDGRYRIDTNGVWISPEDRNAEFNDAGDDVVSDNYVSSDDIFFDDTPANDDTSISEATESSDSSE